MLTSLFSCFRQSLLVLLIGKTSTWGQTYVKTCLLGSSHLDFLCYFSKFHNVLQRIKQLFITSRVNPHLSLVITTDKQPYFLAFVSHLNIFYHIPYTTLAKRAHIKSSIRMRVDNMFILKSFYKDN